MQICVFVLGVACQGAHVCGTAAGITYVPDTQGGGPQGNEWVGLLGVGCRLALVALRGTLDEHRHLGMA